MSVGRTWAMTPTCLICNPNHATPADGAKLFTHSSNLRVAAGKPEGSLDERWADLGDAAHLVAAAPDDEILGEILALQARPPGFPLCAVACYQDF